MLFLVLAVFVPLLLVVPAGSVPTLLIVLAVSVPLLLILLAGSVPMLLIVLAVFMPLLIVPAATSMIIIREVSVLEFLQSELIYLAKFLASFLLPPGVFIAIFLALAIYASRFSRRLALLLLVPTVVFYLMSTSLVAGLFMRSLENEITLSDYRSGDVIVVLGGGAVLDNQNLAEFGSVLTTARLLYAYHIYQEINRPILLSGGAVYDGASEALLAKRELIRLGVPEEMILTEPASRTTKENAAFAGEVLTKHGYRLPVLVTSAYHMPRAVRTFELAGIEVLPAPCDYFFTRERQFQYTMLMPTADSFGFTSLYLKERLRLLVLLVGV